MPRIQAQHLESASKSHFFGGDSWVWFHFLLLFLALGSNLLCSQNSSILFFTGYDGLLVNTVTFLSRNCPAMHIKRFFGRFLGSPAVRTLLLLQGAQVGSLVWELRSQPHGMAPPKKISQKPAKNFNYLGTQKPPLDSSFLPVFLCDFSPKGEGC